MVYSEQVNHEWGTEVYPLILKPTMKELQLSKGTVWKPESRFGKEMQRKTGIRPKGTHFKMDIGQKKVGLSELLVIRASEDGLNDFTKKIELMAIPVKTSRSRK